MDTGVLYTVFSFTVFLYFSSISSVPSLRVYQAFGMQEYIRCLSQARENWEGCVRKGIRHKNGGGVDGGEGTDSPDGMAPIRVGGTIASVILPRAIKKQKNGEYNK